MPQQKKSQKNVFFATILAVLVVGGLTYYNAKLQNPEPASGTETSEEAVVINKDTAKKPTEKESDFYLGNEHAPIVMIEYASLSCNHCAAFHESIVEPLIQSHINTGKVKYIYRDFPRNEADVKAALLSRCFGKMRYFSFVKAFFLSQSSWAFTNDYESALKKIVAPIGIDEAKYAECTTDKKAEEQIIQGFKEAVDFGVNSTPTIFVNGIEYEGDRTYSSFAAHLDEIISGKKQ